MSCYHFSDEDSQVFKKKANNQSICENGYLEIDDMSYACYSDTRLLYNVPNWNLAHSERKSPL